METHEFLAGSTATASPIPGAVKPMDAIAGSPGGFRFRQVHKPGGAGNLSTGIHGNRTLSAARVRQIYMRMVSGLRERVSGPQLATATNLIRQI